MVALRDLLEIDADLDRLAGALESLGLEPDLTSLDAERDRLARTIRHYLIPRAGNPSAPLTVVFAGPTGAGKSTLINSLTGLELSEAGVIRPTTTGPVVLVSDDLVDDFETIAGIDCDVVVGVAPILDSMVLVDTPDIDSTSAEHRAQAETLIDNADVVVFVTSALRYADSVPWQVLRRAESRGTEVIHVLNRVSSATRGAVVDFSARLSREGLGDDVVTVPEHHLTPGAQRVPSLAVRSIRRGLASLADDREDTAERAFDRVLRSVLRQVAELVDALDGVSGQLASLEAELTLSLTSRPADLDLTSVAPDFYVPAPVHATPLQVRRWKRSERREALSPGDIDDLVTGIESLVHRDLRRWLAENEESFPARVDPRLVVPQILPVVRLAMEGWVDFVRRIAEEESLRHTGLAQAALVSTAINPDDLTAASLLFFEEAEAAVGRARRELFGRLEVVYEQAGAQIVDLIQTRIGEPDLTGLRAALGAVTSKLAPIHA